MLGFFVYYLLKSQLVRIYVGCNCMRMPLDLVNEKVGSFKESIMS